MDLTKYEQITAREVLRRLAEGETVYDEMGYGYCIKDDTLYQVASDSESKFSRLTVSGLLEYKKWYIQKPFDVRDAMRDREDEWVGKFRNNEGRWMKVGFCSKYFKVVAVTVDYGMSVKMVVWGDKDYSPIPVELDACIPIDEEVSK